MASEFFCNSCKCTCPGEPKLNNGSAKFCNDCFARMHSNAIMARRIMLDEVRGECPYCGGPSDEKGNNVCSKCHRMRERMLFCIRYGPKVAEYANKCEEREAPVRKQRDAQKPKEVPTVLPEPQGESRLDRLERMMGGLIEAISSTMKKEK